MPQGFWDKCLAQLENDLSPQQFNTWIRPIQAQASNNQLMLLVPNQFVLDWIKDKYLVKISSLINKYSDNSVSVLLDIGSDEMSMPDSPDTRPISQTVNKVNKTSTISRSTASQNNRNSTLNPNFTFETFVEGKCNQLGRAASMQVAENPGHGYNPLLLYGGVGLGKTHLMHAVGNQIMKLQPGAKVVYLHSERFVAEMVKALQHGNIDNFKRYYRSVDALLVDDIQFFAGKEQSQEEFFHTFNSLQEANHQIIMTCDRYPKEVDGLEDRLKSRFGWGLPVAIETPELETRVAIIKSKALHSGVDLPNDVAFFIAKRIRSNIRELEGALRRVIANAQFTGHAITPAFAKEALRDLLAIQDRQLTIDNIQKTVADYFNIRVADLLSKRRNRSITRPRQIAMALCKELTSHSLPEIGDAFGGRDHTTVLHACRKVKELIESETSIEEGYTNLINILNT